MTVRLTPTIGRKLLAEPAQEAVQNYIQHRAHFHTAVCEGLSAADRGELHDHDDVMSMMNEIIVNG